jgi:hypothetical protein
MKNFVKPILFVLFILIAAAAISCGSQYSSTDTVSFTNINTFLNDADYAKGNRKTYAEMPAVQLSHQVHERAGVKCVVCHHKTNNDGRIKRCNQCHKGIRGVEDMHKFCLDCHEKRKGPQKCAQCHPENEKHSYKKTTSEYDPRKIFTPEFHKHHTNIQCQTCHHKEKGTQNLKKCRVCHESDVPRMRIMHFYCRDCHMKNKKGPVTCTDCHK